ncbi:hypothetical protein V3C99_008352, partial [Haemonchus contortus]|uniref:Secreted protein n=1 Tax=Haemonchus contortus TaxID=6289 RepID=A0A7I4YMB8_HAECO
MALRAATAAHSAGAAIATATAAASADGDDYSNPFSTSIDSKLPGSSSTIHFSSTKPHILKTTERACVLPRHDHVTLFEFEWGLFHSSDSAICSPPSSECSNLV